MLQFIEAMILKKTWVVLEQKMYKRLKIKGWPKSVHVYLNVPIIITIIII